MAALPLDQPILIAYSAIVTMAVVPIVIGSFRSLTQKATEKMSAKDAWMFPLVGSTSLFGLYMLFKMFSKAYINQLLTIYFLVIGIGATAVTTSPWLEVLFPEKSRKKTFTLNLKWLLGEPLTFTIVDVVGALVGVAICVWYIQSKYWIANNLLGFAFSVQAIALLSLGSFKTACVLLIGLFFYDVFWVFGTEVMVTVAKSFDAPIKMVVPKDIFAEEYKFAMLGLGDIVIPGVFIALMLRFDAKQSIGKKTKQYAYFIATMIAYLVGLITTIGVMHIFQAGQPALLYIVPACLGAPLLLSLVRGELELLLAYSEEDEEKEKEEKEEGKESKGNKEKKS